MNISININDGQATATTQGVATSATALADQNAGHSMPAADMTVSPPSEFANAEARNAGGPSVALIQEVETALGQLDNSVGATTNGAKDAGPAPA